MVKREDIEKKTFELANSIVTANNLEIYDVEYVKEGKDNYLRIYLDGEKMVTVDDCAVVSRAVNELLDKEDYIKEPYIFEVSSLGLTRPVKRDKDFEKSLGKLLDIKTFKPYNKVKEFQAV